MVIASLILSPVRETSLHKLPLTEDQLAMLQEQASELADLVKPLTALATRKQVDTAMNEIAEEFLHGYNEVWHSVELSHDEFIEFAKEGYRYIADLVKEDTDILRPTEKESLLDMLESRLELLEVLTESSEVEQSRLTDIIMECIPSFERADMCLLAISLVLADKVRDWRANSIRLLCQVATEHTLRIEDTFIAHDRELIARLRTKAETISVEEVRRELGLSD